MEKTLIKYLLNYDFYNDTKDQIPKTVFSKELLDIYEILCSTHEKYKRDISLGEIKELYKANNPTATRAKLDNIEFILDSLKEITEIKLDVAKEIIQKVWITEAGRQIAQIGIDIVNGKTASFSKAREIIEKIEQGTISNGDDLQQVSDDIEEILNEIKVTTKWAYNIKVLAEHASGLGPGIFEGVFSRVETGKTAFAVSLVASPGGFCDQGAIVHYYGNEEAVARTKGRAIMAYTGMPLMELSLKIPEAKQIYGKINKGLKFFECKGRNISDISAHINKHTPDIVVVDQLDKLDITGSFAREDERLGELYIRFRDILKNCAGIALSQANADAEGKTLLATTNMAAARTSKAAECDVLIGIGKSSLHAENTRILNLIKNKITGSHQEIVCQLIPEISRYVG